VPPLPIGKPLDAVCHIGSELLDRRIPLLVQALELQRGAEAFDHRIVPAIAAAAHAANDPVRSQHRLVRGAGVLNAAIRVMQQTRCGCRLATASRHSVSDSAAEGWASSTQPTTRRQNASISTANVSDPTEPLSTLALSLPLRPRQKLSSQIWRYCAMNRNAKLRTYLLLRLYAYVEEIKMVDDEAPKHGSY
jgi:hypothetical protein